MIIDSPIISGSSAASGSLNQFGNVSITGSLFVNGVVVTGNTGSAESASYAGAYTLTSSFQSYTASTDARIASINTSTASLNSYTASTDAKITSINAFSASILNYTSSTDAKLTALYAFSSSLLSYTSSTDAKIASIYSTTASLNASVASLNAQTASLLSYTSSNDATNTTQNTRLSALEAATASIYTTTASLNASVTSLNSYTSSNSANVATLFATSASLNSSVSTLFAASASLNANVAGLNSYTSSNSANIATLFAASASLNASVAGLNTYTSSLNAKTASFATTGSNTLTGVQYVSNNSQATSFTSTASIYTDGGMRVTRDAYVSGTLFLNNLTVFGTQSVNFITSSQLNISTNIITVNTSTPTVRFGGLAVQDSGSGATGLTGSILWDSQDNQWIYSNPSGSTYDSAVFLVGPRSTGALGSEVGITTNALAKGDGLHHMTSSGIFESGSGDVGIGTTSPNFTTTNRRVLDINGTSTSLIALSVGGTAKAYIYHGGTDFSVANYTNGGSLGFNTNDGADRQRMTIISNGNVGIGTSNPATKLQLVNTDADVELRLTANNSGGTEYDPIIRLTGQSNSLSEGFRLLYDNSVGDTYFDNVYDGGSDGQAAIRFRTKTNGTAVNALTILHGGSVGIGTTSPQRILTVYNSNAATLYQTPTSGTGSSDGFYVGQTSDVSYVWNYNNFPLVLAVNNAEVMRITSGNVGIGTTNPTTRLHVSGTVGGVFEVDGASAVNALYVSASGFVGIGTTSPSQLVEARLSTNADAAIQVTNPNTGGAATAQFFVSNGTNRTQFYHTGTSYSTSGAVVASQGGIFTNSAAGLAMIAQNASGLIRFATGGTTEKVRIDASGNVGIGTTNPTYTLDVSGTGRFTGNVLISKSNDATVEVNSTTAASYSAFFHSESGTAKAYWEYVNSNFETAARRNYLEAFNSVGGFAVFTAGTKALDINTAGNVGIGTTTNPTKLTVYAGSGNISGTNDAIRLQVSGYNNAARNTIVWGQDSSNLVLARFGLEWNLSTSQMNFVWRDVYSSTTGSTELMRLQGDGNLGIGTSSPVTKLDVAGKIRLTDDLQLISANPTIVWGSGTLRFYDNTNAAVRMIIAADGNVGIGTTSPATTLDVNGTGLFRGRVTLGTITTGQTYGQLNVWDSTAGSGTSRIADFTNGVDMNINFYVTQVGATTKYAEIASYSTLPLVLNNTSGGNVGIGTTGPASKLHVVGSSLTNTFRITDGSNYTIVMGYSGSGNTGLISTLGGTAALALGTNSIERLTILAGGNVGIGTISPKTRLDVAGAGGKISITNTGTSDYGELQFYESSTLKADIWVNGSSQTNWAGANSFNIYQASNAPIAFYTNAANERMRIEGGGNVGIGTTSPEEKLVVSGGSIVVKGTTYPSLNLYTTSGTNWGITNRYTGNRLSIDVIGTGEVVNILSNGNVGIGTTNPTSLLHAVASGVNVAYFNRATSDGDIMTLAVGGTNAFIFNTTSGVRTLESPGAVDFRHWVNGAERMRITSGGNVGIGTTNPSGYKLKVQNTGTTGISIETVGSDSGNPHLQMLNGAIDTTIAATSNGLELTTYSGHSLLLRTSNVERMRITSGGNVGIGTTSPSEILHLRDSANGYTGLRLEGNGSYAGSDWTIYASSLSAPSADDFLGFYNNSTADGASASYKLRIFKTGAIAINTTNATGLAEGCLYIRPRSANTGQSAISIQDYLERNRWVINGQDATNDFSFNIYSTPSATNDFTRRLRIGQDGVFSFGGTDTTYRYNFEGGSVYIPGGQSGPSTAAYTSWNQLVFADQYSDVARGPNKIVTYGRGTGWVGGIGIHNDTQAYYAGGTHKFYKFDGTTATLNLSLDGSGNLVATGDVTAYSDIKLKENIITVDNAVKKVLAMRGVFYNRIDNKDESRKVGVIAQEIQEILPEVVTASEDGTLGVSYGNIVGVLIEAIKEQQQQIDELKYLLQTINK